MGEGPAKRVEKGGSRFMTETFRLTGGVSPSGETVFTPHDLYGKKADTERSPDGLNWERTTYGEPETKGTTMAQAQEDDRRQEENMTSDQRMENEPISAEAGSGSQSRRASGQGEVRRPEDGRLKDNLSPEQRSAIGKKGGEAVSRNREHMAEIGRRGGEAVSRDREHMAVIGRKGGEAVSQDRERMAEIGRKGGRS